MLIKVLLFLLVLSKTALAADPPLTLYDEGTKQGVIFKINCVGSGIACSKSGITGTVTASGGSGWTLGASNVGISTTNNVGIGTAAPIFPLEIVALNVVGDTAVSIRNSDGSTNDSASLKLVVSGTGSSSSRSELTSIRTSSTTQDLSFKTNVNGLFSEVMRLTGGGNIGIGTTSPGTALVLGSGQITMPVGSAVAPTMLFSNSTNSGFYTVAAGTISYSAAGAPVVLMSANTGNGSFPKAFRLSSTTIMGWSSGNPDNASDDTSLTRGTAGTIYVGMGAGASNGTLIARNVGIGTTTPAGALTVMSGNVGIGTWVPTSTLEVKGTAALGISSSTASIILGASAISFSDSSHASTGNTQLIPAGWSNRVDNTIGWSAGNPGTNDTAFSRLSAGVIGVGTGAAVSTAGTLIVGNVGIGTIVPASKLAVAGGVGIGTGLNSSYVSTAAPIGGMIVEGNVGIGSLTPGTALDVTGTIRASTGTAGQTTCWKADKSLGQCTSIVGAGGACTCI